MGYKGDSEVWLPYKPRSPFRPTNIWQVLLWLPMIFAGLLYVASAIFLIFYEGLGKRD